MAHQKTKVVSLILALVMLMATVFAFPFSVSADDTDSTSSNSYIHNFTEKGKDQGLKSDFYTISGNLASNKSTVYYNDLELTLCLKMETETSISFNAPADGTLTLVFDSGASGKRIYIDYIDKNSPKTTIGDNCILTVNVTAGYHKITKADAINLYYIVYTPASTGGGEHTHDFVNDICSCGAVDPNHTHNSVNGTCSVCKVALLLAKNESGEETYIENTYFEFLGASIRYADANGVTKSTDRVDIRFSYKFKEGVEITKWGWDYKLGTKVTGSKEGVSMTDDNVTNLVFTKVAFVNFEYKIQARIWFEVEIDGKIYTVYGNYDSRTTLEVVKAYTILTDSAYADAKDYAKAVYAEYRESSYSNPYVYNFTVDGFTSNDYDFAGDQITNGKHGTYTYDFGSGTEKLNDALKLDKNGSVTFKPEADGTVTIAVAAETGGRTVVINDGSSDVGTVEIKTAKTLFVLTVKVSANTTYTIKRTSGESGLYYVAFTPTTTTN